MTTDHDRMKAMVNALVNALDEVTRSYVTARIIMQEAGLIAAGPSIVVTNAEQLIAAYRAQAEEPKYSHVIPSAERFLPADPSRRPITPDAR